MWSSCSKTCDEGITTRSRLCDDPAPFGDGNNCNGSAIESESCKLQICAGIEHFKSHLYVHITFS